MQGAAAGVILNIARRDVDIRIADDRPLSPPQRKPPPVISLTDGGSQVDGMRRGLGGILGVAPMDRSLIEASEGDRKSVV